MLIDVSQTREAVKVSYVNPNGSISIKTFNVNDLCGGFYTFQVCSETDPDRDHSLKGFRGEEPVRRAYAKRFNDISLRDFLMNKIPAADKEEIFAHRIPTAYTVDIEIDLSDDKAEIFPDPKLALFEICTIQITADNLNTIVLTKDKNRIKPGDEQVVQKLVKDHFKDCTIPAVKNAEFKIAFIQFDSEKELIQHYLKLVKEHLHFTLWFNSWQFDLPYLYNRMKKLGINPADGSPTGEYKDYIKYPKHRLTQDFMEIVGKHGGDLKLQNKTLNNVAKKICGVGKVDYKGSFKEMYMGDYNFFQFYGVVDTILLQVIHQHRLVYLNTVLTLAYFSKISVYDAWQTTKISAADIWDELYESGSINPYVNDRRDKKPFEGGYVKAPIRKFAVYPTCFDFNQLYPNLYGSTNISFENFVTNVKTQEEVDIWNKKGYFVATSGNVYKNDKDYAMRRVQMKKKIKRKAYQSLERDIWNNIETVVESEMKKRGLNIH